VVHADAIAGNVAFELDWQATLRRFRRAACGCTFCTKHGGVVDVARGDRALP
jgi:hypothetical protein